MVRGAPCQHPEALSATEVTRETRRPVRTRITAREQNYRMTEEVMSQKAGLCRASSGGGAAAGRQTDRGAHRLD